MIKDGFGPEETNVVAYPINFNFDLCNLFAIIPFEDTHLHEGGDFTGSISQLVVQPKPRGGKSSQITGMVFEIITSAYQFIFISYHSVICMFSITNVTDGLSIGAVLGIVFGVMSLVVIIIGTAVFTRRYMAKKNGKINNTF